MKVVFMTYAILPVTENPWQVFTVDLAPDGVPIHARVEIRYLSAADVWVISIWDHSCGKILVNQIPLICSYGEVNDLLVPFGYLRDGQGIGSLFVLRDTDEPKTVNPAKDTMTQFQVLWGDTYG